MLGNKSQSFAREQAKNYMHKLFQSSPNGLRVSILLNDHSNELVLDNDPIEKNNQNASVSMMIVGLVTFVGDSARGVLFSCFMTIMSEAKWVSSLLRY